MTDKDNGAGATKLTGEAPDERDEGPSTNAQAETGRSVPLIERLAGFFRPRQGSGTIRESLEDALAEADPDEGFTAGERTMLHNILRLREVRVEDVMIPRADIESVDISITLADLLRVFQQSGHSRMPACSGSLDDPRGMVHIRDVLNLITRTALETTPDAAQGAPVRASDLGAIDLGRTIEELDLLRTVLFVPSSMPASDLMARMQAARIQMALVIDEYGGTDGLVSLEDIVEMIVGDIEDEHDESESVVQQTSENVFMVNARAELDEVAEAIEGFQAGEDGEDVDTVAGLILTALGRVPVRGEVMQVVPGFEFQIVEADQRRVRKVRIIRDRSVLSGQVPSSDTKLAS